MKNLVRAEAFEIKPGCGYWLVFENSMPEHVVYHTSEMLKKVFPNSRFVISDPRVRILREEEVKAKCRKRLKK